MPILPHSKLTDEKPRLPEPRSVSAFGMIPVVILRHIPDEAGRLLEVDKAGCVLNDWPLSDNAIAVGFLTNRTVIIPPYFPNLEKALKINGADVIVTECNLTPSMIADLAFGDVLLI